MSEYDGKQFVDLHRHRSVIGAAARHRAATACRQDSLPGRVPGVSAMPSLRNDPTPARRPSVERAQPSRVLTRHPWPGSDRSGLIKS